MQAMQDLSVLADENGHRIMGACPPEQTTTLQLVRSFVRYARLITKTESWPADTFPNGRDLLRRAGPVAEISQ
jgi:hypothetical protein